MVTRQHLSKVGTRRKHNSRLNKVSALLHFTRGNLSVLSDITLKSSIPHQFAMSNEAMSNEVISINATNNFKESATKETSVPFIPVLLGTRLFSAVRDQAMSNEVISIKATNNFKESATKETSVPFIP